MTTSRRPLLVPVTDLRKRPGSRKDVHGAVPANDLHVIDSRVPEGAEITLDAEIESLTDGVVVTGTVRAPWEAVCRRCLTAVHGELVIAMREVFAVEPLDEDTHPLTGEHIDLEPIARELVTVELPLAPVCRVDCAGLCPTCGADRNVTPCGCATVAPDPRWAGLTDLKFDQPGDSR